MFIAALFTIAKLWKHPDALQLMNGLRKCDTHTHTHTHTLEFYSVTRKNETMWFEGKQMQSENLMLSEVSEAQKVKGHMFSLICRETHNTNISNIMKNMLH
jgi:hypothetical protein